MNPELHGTPIMYTLRRARPFLGTVMRNKPAFLCIFHNFFLCFLNASLPTPSVRYFFSTPPLSHVPVSPFNRNPSLFPAAKRGGDRQLQSDEFAEHVERVRNARRNHLESRSQGQQPEEHSHQGLEAATLVSWSCVCTEELSLSR